MKLQFKMQHFSYATYDSYRKIRMTNKGLCTFFSIKHKYRPFQFITFMALSWIVPR